MSYAGRTLLLHAKRKWPTIIVTALWPFALTAAVERHNRIDPKKDLKSPTERFSRTDDEILLTDFHTWGCPVFVLREENQSGLTGTPKWEPRSRAGVYLGHSPCHSGNVALVLNLRTGHISPQYHVVFDDEFSTVAYLENDNAPPNWKLLCESSREDVTDGEYKLAETWFESEHTERDSNAFQRQPINVPVPPASEGDTPVPPASEGDAPENASPDPPPSDSLAAPPLPRELIPEPGVPDVSLAPPAEAGIDFSLDPTEATADIEMDQSEPVTVPTPPSPPST